MADRFLREMNKTKIEIQGAQKAVEVAKNTSENFAKEAQYAKDNTTQLHDKVANLTKKAETLSNAAKGFVRKIHLSQKAMLKLFMVK